MRGDCGLRIADLISQDMRSHEWIDQRSLALDRAVVEKLRAEPALVDRARQTLGRWLEQRRAAVPPVLLEWRERLRRLQGAA